MSTFINIFFGIIAAASVMALLLEYRNKLRKIESEQASLSQRLSDIERENAKLKEANPKRINYFSYEEIETAMLELAVHEIESETKHELERSRIATIREHLSKAHTPTKKG